MWGQRIVLGRRIVWGRRIVGTGAFARPAKRSEASQHHRPRKSVVVWISKYSDVIESGAVLQASEEPALSEVEGISR